MSQRKRYVVAGTGGRGIHMFAKPLLSQYSEFCELVGLFDHNPLRMQAANEILGTDLPTYSDFQQMLEHARPDAVIIATRDCTHAQYIVQAMAAGKRAISEKPLCVDGRQCREILKAEAKYSKKGAQCFVTHNMRYGPSFLELKRLLDAGTIGAVKSINFHESLDRRHGADYFRRWHRMLRNSGGLLVHKASHHFDALNWLVGSKPDELVAQGTTCFYGKNGPFRHTRCEGCPHAETCDFHVDMWKSPGNVKLYKNAEKADGYIRDGCVFAEEIDIQDQVAVLYTYENGVRVVYSLTAFATYEGWHIQIEGTEGRLELRELFDTSWAGGKTTVYGLESFCQQELILYSIKEGARKLTIPEVAGGHGGADPAIQHDFFARPFHSPPTANQAPLEQAVQAVLIGHAANVSIAKGSKPVRVQEFLHRG